jgi:hypothetical protein
MRRIRSKLTYANVISTLCLFLLLGGGAALAASKLAKNSVGTKQIKNSAVTAAKIKKGTITGTQINLAKLGTVPSATNAATANTATTASTANALAALEPVHLVGASGQPPFLDGSSNLPPTGGLNYQSIGFYKDHDGIVHLRGAVEVGKEENPVKGLIFQLPPGFRPASGVLEAFPGINETDIFVFGSNATAAGKNIECDVLSTAEGGEPAVLSGITFRAEG